MIELLLQHNVLVLLLPATGCALAFKLRRRECLDLRKSFEGEDRPGCDLVHVRLEQGWQSERKSLAGSRRRGRNRLWRSPRRLVCFYVVLNTLLLCLRIELNICISSVKVWREAVRHLVANLDWGSGGRYAHEKLDASFSSHSE